jgi:hypothetical protein
MARPVLVRLTWNSPDGEPRRQAPAWQIIALFAMALRSAILPPITCDGVVTIFRKERCQQREPPRKCQRQMDVGW